MKKKIKVGISSCLLGEKVRWDGGHKLDRFLKDTLGKYVEYIPVCPEVESGFPTPRDPLRLMGDPESPRLVTAREKIDYTDMMANWAQRRVEELAGEELCGFIFKTRSPSSGMRQIKVYDEKGVPHKKGVGIFARIFMERFPLVPVEDEGRLHDPHIRENFIERLFVLERWRETVSRGARRADLVDYHTRHKLMIFSHSPKHLKALGKLVADAKEYSAKTLFKEYQNILAEALKLKATTSKHVNVLYHIMGYFKNNLTADEKQELISVIENYRNGYLPLIVPVTLANHYTGKYKQQYLKEQYYLNPHPLELQLRNHV